ncbi:hypothetical protein ATCV1_z670R [Acanthocystis turfacea chlorella virus 1]|uniref:Uncharacterized protein z670R n=1 Tax=Chlorovirus heliozoae TaxID=322019 RepID=A7K9T0_9PHYC|nr:hypothetical protein ATCV1_z670R [Acanthocystis turfacea chlorella virus 1]ABT16804.1 hypothetical protein ATCV1_z670R [Acanthocystis turfacea chlorella virus 1]
MVSVPVPAELRVPPVAFITIELALATLAVPALKPRTTQFGAKLAAPAFAPTAVELIPCPTFPALKPTATADAPCIVLPA